MAGVSREQRTLFNSIMSNMARGGEVRGTASIPLSLLFVDPRYQGKRKHKKLEELIANWDECKLGNITVVPHKETANFAVVDGQGRLLAATRKGLTELWSTVLLNIPEDPEWRLKYEAAFFIAQDNECENLRLIEKHDALVLNGDKSALIIQKLCDNYEIILSSVGPRKKPHEVGSYTCLYRIAKTEKGEEALNYIFDIIHEAQWDKVSDGISVWVVNALYKVWRVHPDKRDEIKEKLPHYMNTLAPIVFKSNAVTSHPTYSVVAATAMYMVDLLDRSKAISMVAEAV